MSEFKQNQHQIQQSGEHVQDTQLAQVELVAALLLKLFKLLKQREPQNSLKTEVKKGKETKETVEIGIDAHVTEPPPPGQKPETARPDEAALKGQAEPSIAGSDSISINLSSSEPKPSLNHFRNSVHRQKDLKALADRQTRLGREPERESPKETSSAKTSDLER